MYKNVPLRCLNTFPNRLNQEVYEWAIDVVNLGDVKALR